MSPKRYIPAIAFVFAAFGRLGPVLAVEEARNIADCPLFSTKQACAGNGASPRPCYPFDSSTMERVYYAPQECVDRLPTKDQPSLVRRPWEDYVFEWSRLADSEKHGPDGKRGPMPFNFPNAINQNMERSYATLLSGFRFGRDETGDNAENGKKLMYEAQIFHNIEWYKWDWWGMNFRADLPLRFVVRQLREDSSPVRTPTYNPGLRLYWWGDDEPMSRAQYFSLGIHHYSNGQAGEALDPVTGYANTVDGTFSTNYIELAYHRAGAITLPWWRLSVRHDFPSDFDPAQEKQFPVNQSTLMLRSKPYAFWGSCKIQGTVSLTYFINGREYVVWNPVAPSSNVSATTRDNIQSVLEFYIVPASWRNLSLYVRYDYGYDYYNINFQHRMNRWSLGVATTNFTGVNNWH